MTFRLIFLLTLAFSALIQAGCRESVGSAPPTTPVLPVMVVRVDPQSSFDYPVTYYGRIEAARTAALSFELAGQLKEVAVDEGRHVRNGDVIARLDTSALEAEKKLLLTHRKTESLLLDRLRRGERDEVIAAARAEAMRLEVEVSRALAEKKRADKVYESRAISRSDYDHAVFTYKAALFALERAKQRVEELVSGSRAEDVDAQANRVAAIDAQLDQLNVQFEKSVLKAPFDGVCIRRMQDEGVTLSPGQLIVEVNESNRMEARFAIPRKNVDLVSGCQSFQIDGQEYPVSGARAISKVDDMTRTVDIVVPVPASTVERVLPGQTCTLTLSKRIESDCVEVPITALVASVRGLWSCYRLRPSGTDRQAVDPLTEAGNDLGEAGNDLGEAEEIAGKVFEVEKVDVSIVHSDGVSAYVTSTMSDRSWIIPSGVHRVVPGMRVRVVEDLP